MHRLRRHPDPYADSPFHDPISPFENRRGYPPRHQGFEADFFPFGDGEDDSSVESSCEGIGGYGYGRSSSGLWKGMRRGRGLDEINNWGRPYEKYGIDPTDFYDSDFTQDGHDFISPYSRARHRHHEAARRAPPHANAGGGVGYKKHNHSHSHQQHRSSHHQHHHIHHHQYFHNCGVQQVSPAVPGPRHGCDDGYQQSNYHFPALPYGNGMNSSGNGGGALLPYNHQLRRFGRLRPQRYGYGGDYGCALHGGVGGGNLPRNEMALGPPLPSQLGIPVPRRY